MAQSHPQSQPLDPMNLALRDTDTAVPAPPWQVEDLIEDAVAPGQRDTATAELGGELPRASSVASGPTPGDVCAETSSRSLDSSSSSRFR